MLAGFPSVGKSTLLNKLTGTFSEVPSRCSTRPAGSSVSGTLCTMDLASCAPAVSASWVHHQRHETVNPQSSALLSSIMLLPPTSPLTSHAPASDLLSRPRRGCMCRSSLDNAQLVGCQHISLTASRTAPHVSIPLLPLLPPTLMTRSLLSLQHCSQRTCCLEPHKSNYPGPEDPLCRPCFHHPSLAQLSTLLPPQLQTAV